MTAGEIAASGPRDASVVVAALGAPTFDVAVATVGDPPTSQAARVLLAMLDPARRT